MESQEIPRPEIIDQAIEGFYPAHAIRAALGLQLWGKIDPGGETAEELAAREGWNATGTRLLLDAVCAIKLLKKEGSRYFLVPESAFYLVPGQPAYQGRVLEYELSWGGNGGLAEAIRSGKRPVQSGVTTCEMADTWNAYYSRSWANPEAFLDTAEKLWQSLEIQARDGLRVLDVACGPAPKTTALGQKHPGVRLTWLDWEEVLQAAIKGAGELGLTNRVTLLPGDLWSTDYGSESYDLAYLGNVTHFFSPEENTRLFRKVHAALAPGGRIVVHSVARREVERVVWDALWLYVATACGGAYDLAEYKAMLENAGFGDVVDINQGPIKALKI